MSEPSNAVTRDELTRMIHAAFGDVTDEDVQTVPELLSLDYGGELRSFGKNYGGRWQDLPHDLLKDILGVFSFANSTSLRYYLPALICSVLVDDDAIRSQGYYVTDSLLHIGRNYQRRAPEAVAFVQRLTAEQKCAIIAFLSWVAWSDYRIEFSGTTLAIWRAITSSS